MNQQPLPSRFLHAIDEKWPALWERVEHFRHARKPDWDPAVFMPLVLWQDFMLGELPDMKMETRVGLTHLISSVGAWRLTQDIVRFEPQLYNELCNSQPAGHLPAGVLGRLPAWGLYIESPQIKIMDMSCAGFFVTFEAFQKPELKLLRLLFVDDALRSRHYIIPLGEWNLYEAFAAVNTRIYRKYGLEQGKMRGQKLEKGIFQAINMLISVCSSWSEGSGADACSKHSQRHAAGENSGWRFLEPAHPVIRIPGSAEVQTPASEESRNIVMRASPRPHIRRAHWQRCWIGPANERSLVNRWIPPTPVAMKNVDAPKSRSARKEGSIERERLT